VFDACNAVLSEKEKAFVNSEDRVLKTEYILTAYIINFYMPKNIRTVSER